MTEWPTAALCLLFFMLYVIWLIVRWGRYELAGELMLSASKVASDHSSVYGVVIIGMSCEARRD